MTNEPSTGAASSATGPADAALAAFLRQHSLASQQVQAVFAELHIGTLYDLRRLMQDNDLRAAAEDKLLDNPLALTALKALTVEQIDNAINLAEQPGVDPNLKAFLAKQGIPPSAEKVLAEFGITSLVQLRDVIEDKKPGGAYEQLKQKLVNSGIRSLPGQFDKLRPSDITQYIAEAQPTGPSTPTQPKTAELERAISEVQALRAKLAGATAADEKAVVAAVGTDLGAVLDRLQDVSLSVMARAEATAASDRAALDRVLGQTIANATAAKQTLEAVDQTPRPLALIMRLQSMLSGFLITPDQSTQMGPALIKLPDNPADLGRDPIKTEYTFQRTYKGSEIRSFAVASAQQSSSSLATAAEASGGGFVGSGVAAVSAAASYADARRSQRDDEQFDSAAQAECGEIEFRYAPRASVVFDRAGVRLSDDATAALQKVADADPGTREAELKSFLNQYGSHIFLRQELGGRYQLTAKGTSHTTEARGKLVSAVAQTMQWAVSASGSYAGVGGAVSAAASIQGQTSAASAKGDRYGLIFNGYEVTVTTETRGGAPGTSPRDVWVQSLKFNSTWAVIDRDTPIAVWELVRSDPTLPPAVKALAPMLEKVWVREIFLPAAQKSYPGLHRYISNHTEITTCPALQQAVERFQGEPPLEIVVTTATSQQEHHPAAVASPNRSGLKLIGGGAHDDYGNGPGGLLTGSYPYGDNAWKASAKDHGADSSSPSTVTAYAIYLYDPDDLWEVRVVPAKSEKPSNRPTATAELPPGFELTGGGGVVDWGGEGIMLTACGPEQSTNSWTVRGKDHDWGDSGTARAWVFGIRPRNGATFSPSRVVPKFTQGNHPALDEGSRSPGEIVIGGGAALSWEGTAGGLLTSTSFADKPQDQAWRARAKEHRDPCNLNMTMWVITRRGTRISD
jgi:hypothetical protein